MGLASKIFEPINLKRPKIPKADPVPHIPGPRGGPAYRPHPDDQRAQNDNSVPPRRTQQTAPLADPLYMQPVMPLTLVCSFAFLCAQVLGLI